MKKYIETIMRDFKKLNNTRHKIYDFLTTPKVVKFSFYASTIILISCLIIGYLVAQSDLPGPDIDKSGFNILDDYISNLGHRNYTPITNFLDDGAMFTAIFLVPLALYMEKIIRKDEGVEKSTLKTILGVLGLLTLLIGMIGLWGIGFFNAEIGVALEALINLDFHKIFSLIVFLGLGSSGLLFGILIISYSTRFPKILGLYMIIVPFTLATLFILMPWIIWLEWLLLLSLFSYLIPCGAIIVKQINTDILKKKREDRGKDKLETRIKEQLKQIKKNFISPRIVRICLILFFVIFIPSLITGYLFANIFDPYRDGFNIIDNYISDLGSLDFTCIPKFLDDAAMISAVLLVPVMFYMRKMLLAETPTIVSRRASKPIKLLLTNIGLLFGLASMVGFFGIGFFSEDTSRELNQFDIKILGLPTHMFFSLLVFAGLIGMGMVIGSYLIMFPYSVISHFGVNTRPKIFVLLGFEMTIWPTMHGIGFIANWPPSQPYHEWFMLFTILVWSVPLFGLLLKKAKDQ